MQGNQGSVKQINGVILHRMNRKRLNLVEQMFQPMKSQTLNLGHDNWHNLTVFIMPKYIVYDSEQNIYARP